MIRWQGSCIKKSCSRAGRLSVVVTILGICLSVQSKPPLDQLAESLSKIVETRPKINLTVPIEIALLLSNHQQAVTEAGDQLSIYVAKLGHNKPSEQTQQTLRDELLKNIGEGDAVKKMSAVDREKFVDVVMGSLEITKESLVDRKKRIQDIAATGEKFMQLKELLRQPVYGSAWNTLSSAQKNKVVFADAVHHSYAYHANMVEKFLKAAEAEAISPGALKDFTDQQFPVVKVTKKGRDELLFEQLEPQFVQELQKQVATMDYLRKNYKSPLWIAFEDKKVLKQFDQDALLRLEESIKNRTGDIKKFEERLQDYHKMSANSPLSFDQSIRDRFPFD